MGLAEVIAFHPGRKIFPASVGINFRLLRDAMPMGKVCRTGKRGIAVKS